MLLISCQLYLVVYLLINIYLIGRVYEPSLSSNSHDSSSFFLGCEQEIRNSEDPVVTVVSGKGVEMDCSFVKDTFMDATDSMVKRALEGLNDSTLGDPKRRIMLESISQTLPM